MNRLRLLLTTLIFLVGLNVLGEKLAITYDYVSEDRTESEQQAVAHAFEQARQEALNKRFGVDISSIVVNQQQEQIIGGEINYSDAFYQLGGTVSRGEWIETTREEVVGEPRYERGVWHIRVRVEGTGRMRMGEPVHISAMLINNTHDRESRKVFYDCDDIFLRFSAPVSGSLLVYLIDGEQQAYCLLPYESSATGYYPIEANREYLLFSENAEHSATEYTLTTERAMEQNVVYIIFSPNVVTKAKDTRADKNWRNEALPRTLSYKDFLQWLSRNQIRDEQMVVQPEVITIKKK